MLAYEITKVVDEETEEEESYYKTIVTSLEEAFRVILKVYDRKSVIVITVWEDNRFVGETRLGRNV